jgi:hypothetical protein
MENNEAMEYIKNFTIKFAKEKFDRDVNVVFKDTHRRWGCCYEWKSLIQFSINFIKENKDNIKAMEALAIHECCHLKIKNHGKDFANLCKQYGVNSNHTYKLSELNIKHPELKQYYLYKCAKCGTEYKSLRMMRKESACRNCCKLFNNNKFSKEYLFKFVEYVSGV